MLDGVEANRTELEGLLHRRMQVRKLEALQQAKNLHILAPAMLCHAAFHQPAQCGEFLGQVPALERCGLIQRIDLPLDQRQVMERIEDDVFPFPAPWMASDDLTAAADRHLVDIAADPDILMAIGDRDGIVVGLVAHERLSGYLGAGLVAGIEGRRWQHAHGGKIALQPFPDRLVLAAQPVALAFAALLLQPGVERIPCRKLRDRHHEVAPGIADEPLDVPLVVAFPWAAIAVPIR